MALPCWWARRVWYLPVSTVPMVHEISLVIVVDQSFLMLLPEVIPMLTSRSQGELSTTSLSVACVRERFFPTFFITACLRLEFSGTSLPAWLLPSRCLLQGPRAHCWIPVCRIFSPPLHPLHLHCHRRAIALQLSALMAISDWKTTADNVFHKIIILLIIIVCTDEWLQFSRMILWSSSKKLLQRTGFVKWQPLKLHAYIEKRIHAHN